MALNSSSESLDRFSSAQTSIPLNLSIESNATTALKENEANTPSIQTIIPTTATTITEKSTTSDVNLKSTLTTSTSIATSKRFEDSELNFERAFTGRLFEIPTTTTATWHDSVSTSSVTESTVIEVTTDANALTEMEQILRSANNNDLATRIGLYDLRRLGLDGNALRRRLSWLFGYERTAQIDDQLPKPIYRPSTTTERAEKSPGVYMTTKGPNQAPIEREAEPLYKPQFLHHEDFIRFLNDLYYSDDGDNALHDSAKL